MPNLHELESQLQPLVKDEVEEIREIGRRMLVGFMEDV